MTDNPPPVSWGLLVVLVVLALATWVTFVAFVVVTSEVWPW